MTLILTKRSNIFHLRILSPAEDAAIHLIILVSVVMPHWELTPHSGHSHEAPVPVLHLLVSVVTNYTHVVHSNQIVIFGI